MIFKAGVFLIVCGLAFFFTNGLDSFFSKEYIEKIQKNPKTPAKDLESNKSSYNLAKRMVSLGKIMVFLGLFLISIDFLWRIK